MDNAAITALGTLVATDDATFTVAHPEHGECYHSKAGALFESNALYIDASGFRTRLSSLGAPECIRVLDVGLGLGYNALCTLEAWATTNSGCDLALISLEINADLFFALQNNLGPWQSGWPDSWKSWVSSLQPSRPGIWTSTFTHPRSPHSAQWTVILGDACQTVPLAGTFGPYHFVWQDAFSPAKNPSLWQAAWFEALAQISTIDVILMSYSVARQVRDALSVAGWIPERLKAGGAKRHWLRARRAAGT